MEVWIDPKETVASTWGVTERSDEAILQTPVSSVIERAVATSPPVQYEDGAFVTPSPSGIENVDGYARIQFNCAVTRTGEIKLTARGYRWDGGDRDGNAMRFKSLFTRAADPTDTVPFETYDRWFRIQRGQVVGYEAGDEYIDFRPDEAPTEEERERIEWEGQWHCIRLRLAELELVRNAPFARYVLQERDEWSAVRGTLRWKPTAFGAGEAS